MPKILYEENAQQHPPLTSRSRKTNRNNAGEEYEYYDEEYDEEEAKEEKNDYDFRDFMDDASKPVERGPATLQVSDLDMVNNTTSQASSSIVQIDKF